MYAIFTENHLIDSLSAYMCVCWYGSESEWVTPISLTPLTVKLVCYHGQDLLHDLLFYPEGPRVRDHLSHGEMDFSSVGGDVVYPFLCVAVFLAYRLRPESSSSHSTYTKVCVLLDGEAKSVLQKEKRRRKKETCYTAKASSFLSFTLTWPSRLTGHCTELRSCGKVEVAIHIHLLQSLWSLDIKQCWSWTWALKTGWKLNQKNSFMMHQFLGVFCLLFFFCF